MFKFIWSSDDANEASPKGTSVASVERSETTSTASPKGTSVASVERSETTNEMSVERSETTNEMSVERSETTNEMSVERSETTNEMSVERSETTSEKTMSREEILNWLGYDGTKPKIEDEFKKILKREETSKIPNLERRLICRLNINRLDGCNYDGNYYLYRNTNGLYDINYTNGYGYYRYHINDITFVEYEDDYIIKTDMPRMYLTLDCRSFFITCKPEILKISVYTSPRKYLIPITYGNSTTYTPDYNLNRGLDDNMLKYDDIPVSIYPKPAYMCDVQIRQCNVNYINSIMNTNWIESSLHPEYKIETYKLYKNIDGTFNLDDKYKNLIFSKHQKDDKSFYQIRLKNRTGHLVYDGKEILLIADNIYMFDYFHIDAIGGDFDKIVCETKNSPNSFVKIQDVDGNEICIGKFQDGLLKIDGSLYIYKKYLGDYCSLRFQEDTSTCYHNYLAWYQNKFIKSYGLLSKNAIFRIKYMDE
jgi:hypothetical protein